MALTPYPAATAAVGRQGARNTIRRALKGVEADPNANPPVAGDPPDEEIDRLASFASARIERFAPGAPQAVRDEALIRMVAYMRQLPGHIRSLGVGSLRIEFATAGVQRPFVSSGARAMLSPWVTRRALPAEEST